MEEKREVKVGGLFVGTLENYEMFVKKNLRRWKNVNILQSETFYENNIIRIIRDTIDWKKK